MTLVQQGILIGLIVLGTFLTRIFPFLLFPEGKEIPEYINYLGKVLPMAVFGLLVIYSVKQVSLLKAPYGIPEALGILVVVLLHGWKRQMLLSIGGGTLFYMILVQTMF